MTLDQRQDIALFRYGVIAPLVTGTSDPAISNREFFRRVAKETYAGPDGKPVTIAASTAEKWYRYYKKNGFEGLMPQPRKDEGVSRKLDQDLQSQIRFMKKEHPRMPAAEIHRKLIENGSIAPGQLSVSTVERFVRFIRSEQELQTGKDMRRYERPHINEVWYGDTCHGPYLKTPSGKNKVFFIVLIDDASRFIVGGDLFFNDNYENLMSVIRSAVSKYGRPKLFSFDNGPNYRNKQMELLAGRIGSSVHYCEPFTPTSKSKIERWFLTFRLQYLSALDMRQFHSLDELRTDFAAYVQRYNQTPHSSLAGMSPEERFFLEPEQIHRLSPECIDNSFLYEKECRVSPDSVLVINKVQYEIHYRYAKQKVRLRYSPDMEKAFVVGPSGDLTPVTLRLLNKHENASVKREKILLSRGGETTT